MDKKTNGVWLAGLLLAVLVAIGALEVAKGGLYIGRHEGDAMHLLEIVFRMADGQWPHLDFMTPIGVLAFAPPAWFVAQGQGIGMAMIYSQLLVAAVLLPALWWAGVSRLPGVLGFVFGLIVIVLATSLVHGESLRSVSISMHYNRWAWAIAFVVIVLGVLPPRGRASAWADGVIIGLGLGALALLKVTYFAAFVVPVGLGLLLRGELRSFLVAVVSGLAVAALMTALAGFAFWAAYLGDMLAVAGSEVRPQPGEPLTAVVAAPAYLGGSLVLIAGVILLRQGARANEGLLLMLLVPGFFYVTYQNFGNDPQWLLLLGVLLLAARPEAGVLNGFGWEMRGAVAIAGAAAFAMTLPSAFNLAFSPFRHMAAEASDYAPILPRSDLHGDLLTSAIRANRVDVRVPLDGLEAGLGEWAGKGDRDALAVLNGEELAACELELGTSAWFDAITQDLMAQGHAGKRVMAADLFSSFWLFGDFKPLIGGAPWYYGGLPGFESADLLVVPICPVAPDIRRQVLETAEEAGIALRDIHRHPLYILLEKG
ncbi:hypothetical protein IV417_01015 [Alphaproteobacteria bacterium KMM 3653]|uniref:DUF2029 domain-containing protein n=1 Tax=Harenicola maris TaxID=2841044 RepID=A0AAP2CMR9_9RHOB|nr:hypothetical protein [Harenicola maris]